MQRSRTPSFFCCRRFFCIRAIRTEHFPSPSASSVRSMAYWGLSVNVGKLRQPPAVEPFQLPFMMREFQLVTITYKRMAYYASIMSKLLEQKVMQIKPSNTFTQASLYVATNKTLQLFKSLPVHILHECTN